VEIPRPKLTVDDLLAQQTGLEFMINGSLEFQRNGPLQLSASDVSISSAGQKLVSFKALTVTFNWRILRLGRFEVCRIWISYLYFFHANKKAVSLLDGRA